MMSCMRCGKSIYRAWNSKSLSEAATRIIDPVVVPGRTKSNTSRVISTWKYWYAGSRRRLSEPGVHDGLTSTSNVRCSSGFTTEAGVPASIFKRLPTSVGTLVKLNFLGTQAPIYVKVNSNLEEVCLEAQLQQDSLSSDWSLFHLSTDTMNVAVAPRNNTGLALLALTAIVPERWCSLHIEAGEGDVHIEKVREGSLWVKTTGGNIHAREVKASMADINSGGGSLQVDTLSAILNVNTEGGHMTVNKILGSQLRIDSGGGNIKLTTLYGDDVSISSRGGSIELNHAQAPLLLDISSGGGAISIGGLEGKAKVVTGGGNVELQLHEQAQEIEIDSGDGNVTLFVSDKLPTKVEYQGNGMYAQEGKMYKLESGRDSGHLTFPAEQDVEGRQGRRADRLPECTVRVRCSGVLEVKTRSWLESIAGDAYFI